MNHFFPFPLCLPLPPNCLPLFLKCPCFLPDLPPFLLLQSFFPWSHLSRLTSHFNCFTSVRNNINPVWRWKKQQNVCPVETQISLGIWSVFTLRSIGSQGPNASLCGQWRLGSDWADALADLSPCWASRSFCLFCHAPAHINFHRNNGPRI